MKTAVHDDDTEDSNDDSYLRLIEIRVIMTRRKTMMTTICDDDKKKGNDDKDNYDDDKEESDDDRQFVQVVRTDERSACYCPRP